MKRIIFVLTTIICSINVWAQNFQWAKSMGGISDDEGYSLAVDAYGNIYTTGYFQRTVDFDPGTGVFNLTSAGVNTEIFVSKLNASGNFLWAKSLGAISSYGYSLAVDKASNIYIAGSYWGTVDFDPSTKVNNLSSVGGPDIFILKLDSSGNFLWAKSFGGTSDDRPYSIKLDGLGNLYTTGHFMGTVDFDPSSGTTKFTAKGEDIFILKLDTSGNFKWAKGIIGTGNNRGKSLAIDGFGNIYTAGIYNGKVDFDPDTSTFNLSTVGKNDIFVLKINTSGDFIWAKTLGGVGDDDGNSITVDSFGNIYTTGSFQLTADFDPNVGIFNLTSKGNYDIFILKLDPSGNLVWGKSMGGANFDFGESIVVDGKGNIYNTGMFGDTANFNLGAGGLNLISVGGYDIYISKHDASGSILWASGIGSVNNDFGNSITFDNKGSLYCTGYFSGNTDFDPNAGTFYLNSNGVRDIFILKLQGGSLGVSDKFNKNLISVFPNPTNNQINIKADASLIGSSYSIYSQIGSLIMTGKLESVESNIFIDEISSGIYSLVVGDNFKQTYKIIKL